MSALPASIANRISKLVLMLSSPNDGEALNAARSIGKVLAANGTDWHAIAAAVAAEPETKTVVVYRDRSAPTETWQQIAQWCWANDRGRLNPKERKFVLDMTRRLVCGAQPTERQGEWLRAIYARLWVAR